MNYQMNTTNESFIEMHKYLKKEGIKNNNFFLQLIDEDLRYVYPFSNNLSERLQEKIIEECKRNYWYFLREVVRIPMQSDNSSMFQLHRGNLALNFCMMNNFNTIINLPVMNYKDISIMIRILWEMSFHKEISVGYINRRLENSKLELSKTKHIISKLPDFIKEYIFNKNKFINNVEKLEFPRGKNEMVTIPAQSIIKDAVTYDKHLTHNHNRLWYNDFVFIKNMSRIIHTVYSKNKFIRMLSEKNDLPHGIILSGTVGDLNVPEQEEIYRFIKLSLPFSEKFYDLSKKDISLLLNRHCVNGFIHIEYHYNELGKDEEWAKRFKKAVGNDKCAIKKELLLEWIEKK